MTGSGRSPFIRVLLGSAVLTLLRSQASASSDGQSSDGWDDWSAWSPCSADCDSGVSTRSRVCRRDEGAHHSSSGNSSLCQGASSQIQVCFLKSCPADQPSARQAACSRYDTKVFSGRQYVWEPFIHPTAPCKLSCRAKGENFYANLADRVEDGTPCGSGSAKAICVSGACKSVGCDGMVASQSHKDKCGVCNGDDSNCRTISGIFTSTELKRGLNYIISIPSGSTNINITELQTSRNLFLLQTTAGKTFVNGGGSSPVSGDVTAAGTVFTYGARSPSSPRESIYSPGPTNITVILKLLLRGNNPGIMYTFNVPAEVSEDVIKQIKHHAEPVKVSSDPERESEPALVSALGDEDEEEEQAMISSSIANKEGSFSNPSDFSPMGLSGDAENEELHSNSEGEEVSHSGSPSYTGHSGSTNSATGPETTRNERLPNPDYERPNYALASSSGGRDYSRDDYVDKGVGTSMAVAANQNAASAAAQDDDYEKRREGEEIIPEGYSRQDKQPEGINPEESFDEYDVDEEYDEETDEGVNDYVDSDTRDELSDEIKDILDDHKIQFNDDEEYASEDFVLEEPNQSVTIPLNSVVDPNEIENWDPDNKNNGNHNNADKMGDGYHETGSEEPFSEEENYYEENDDDDNSSNFDNDNRKHKSRTSLGGSTSAKENNNLADADSKLYRDSSYRNSADSRGATDTLARSKYPFAIPRQGHYQIPRYSQSFTFAERYKDIYSHNTGRQQQRRRPRAHHRQHGNHHHNRDSIQQTPGGISAQQPAGFDRSRNGEASDTRQARPHSRHTITHSTDTHRPTDRHGENVSAFGSSSSDVSDQERHQRDRDRDSRERRLRDRQALIEERRRRLEEQRQRYEQQLREYRERVRQRQAEIEASRSQSSSVDEQVTESRTPEADRHHRNQQRYGPDPSQQISQSSVISSRGRSSDSYPYTQAPPASNVDVDQVAPDQGSSRHTDGQSRGRPGYSRSPYDASDYDRQRLETSRTYDRESPQGPSSSFGQPQTSRGSRVTYYDGRDQYDSDPGEPARTASQQTHPQIIPRVQSPPRQELESPTEGRGGLTVRTHSSSDRGSFGNVDQQTNPVVIPRVQSPPRQELTSPAEDRVDGGPPLVIPRLKQPEPQYIPGSPSRPSAAVSALSGNEDSQGQSTNQISTSNNNYIPANRISNQELPVQSPDILPNQIPLNTLTTDQVIRNAAYEWRISGLTECTHQCGGGVQQTVVVCVDTFTQATVTDENCRQLRKPKTLAVKCNKRPCPAEWTPGPWTPCTVTCGRGEQTRTVVCQARVSPTLNLTMPSDKCEGKDRLPNRQACDNNPCSSWKVGNWSECSAPCGDGERTRLVQCLDLEKNVVPDDACVELKPDDEESCNLGECGRGWFFTEWPEECPAECGTGELTRNIFCADEFGSALPDNRCDNDQRPATARSCKASRPCGGLWFTGQWSKCDATCGSGYRRRDVLCIKALAGGLFAIVGEENCQGVVKPETSEACDAPACVSQWYMTSWTECSQSCGTGYRSREVKCLDPDQRPSDHCPLHKRPKTRDTCNTESCAVLESSAEDPSCIDKFAQCAVVKRARLCRFDYYTGICCKSCKGET